MGLNPSKNKFKKNNDTNFFKKSFVNSFDMINNDKNVIPLNILRKIQVLNSKKELNIKILIIQKHGYSPICCNHSASQSTKY